MDEPTPRFEFRAFASSFGIVEDRLRALSRCESIRESEEVYLVSRRERIHNVKIRAGVLDIKALLGEERGLERWTPRLKAAFPLAAAVLRQQVLPTLGPLDLQLERHSYELEQFLEELVRPQPNLVAAQVFKRRFAFTVEDCIAELAEVWVNGAAVRTAAIESTDADAVLRARRTLRLEEYENVSYALAIRRIVGMVGLTQR